MNVGGDAMPLIDVEKFCLAAGGRYVALYIQLDLSVLRKELVEAREKGQDTDPEVTIVLDEVVHTMTLDRFVEIIQGECTNGG